MIKRKTLSQEDIEAINEVHFSISEASRKLANVRTCYMDRDALFLRIRARDYLSKGRKELRKLRDFIKRRDEGRRRRKCVKPAEMVESKKERESLESYLFS